MIKNRLSHILNDLEEMIAKRRQEIIQLNDESDQDQFFPRTKNQNSGRKRFSSEKLKDLWPPLRFLIELVQLCYYRLDEHKASQMAAALTYRTIFAIVPVIILGMLGFRMFGDSADAYKRLSESATTLLSYDVKADTPEAIEFKNSINTFVQPFILEVSQTKLQNIGILGGMLFVWAAISFFATAEQAANQVFNVRRGRTWDKRIARYWTIMTLGPLIVVAGIYLAQTAYEKLNHIQYLGTVTSLLYNSRAYIASWLALLLLTLLLPRCKVSIGSAAIASAFTALIWTLGRWGFSIYVGHFLPYSKLYGTIGLIPLFLLWLYLNWYVALFGMVLTQALQVLTDEKPQKTRHAPADSS